MCIFKYKRFNVVTIKKCVQKKNVKNVPNELIKRLIYKYDFGFTWFIREKLWFCVLLIFLGDLLDLYEKILHEVS